MAAKSSDATSAKPAGNSAREGAPDGTFRSSSFQRSICIYLPATAAIRLVNFGRILLLTWFMTQRQFGLFTMVLLIMNVITPLGSLGINDAVTRYVPQYEQRGSLAAFLRRTGWMLLAIAVLNVVLIWLFSPWLGYLFYAQSVADPAAAAHRSAEILPLAHLSAVIISLLIVYFFLMSVMKGLRMFSALSRLELSHAGLFLVGCLATIAIDRLSALTMAVVYGLSLALPVVYFGPQLFKRINRLSAQSRPLDEDRMGRKLLKFSIWTSLAGVSWQILMYYPAWLLNKIHGHEAVAIFNAVRQIGQFIQISAVTVSVVAMTTVTKTWESQDRRAAERQLSLAFRGTSFGLFLLCVVIALCRNVILQLFNPSYHAGAAILPLLLTFFLLAAFLAFLPVHFLLREKTQYMFMPWAVGIGANVLLGYWLVGPNLHMLQTTRLWKAAGPFFSATTIAGFSDAMGLGAAAWCGVLAMGMALILCVILIHVVGGRLDRSSAIVIASSLLLAAKPWILAIGAGVLLWIAWRMDLIFTACERRQIFSRVTDALRQLPISSRWLPKKNDTR